jgi:ketosteroid isomerase-like protein
MSPLEIVQRFVERLNAHDLDGMVALLSQDHRFIDSLGTEARGRDTLRKGWQEYFRMVPDYQIEVQRAFRDRAEVLLVGVARGTYTADGKLNTVNAWTTPAVWRARIGGGLLEEWQVYADNEPIRRCMARASA